MTHCAMPPKERTPAATCAAGRLGVSIVVPLYNERECVGHLVQSLAELEKTLWERYELELLLVDDGSQDGTPHLLERAVGGRRGYRVLRHDANRGIAAAIQSGLRAAVHDVAASMDCDGSYDPGLLAELFPLLTPGVDLVTASPYHVRGAVENVPLWRLRLSRLASTLYGVACWHRLSCYTSCFRVYRRSTIAPIELENPGFVGVAELVCRVLQQGGRVVEHPARLRSRVAGYSKMRTMRVSLTHLRLIAKLLFDRLLRRQTSLATTPRMLGSRPADDHCHAAVHP
jgi:glycosyltransferase involved in cell wall biosynthesis